jgi:hypothetical protein
MSVNLWCLRPMARIEVVDIPVFPGICHQHGSRSLPLKPTSHYQTTARPEPAELYANRAFFCTKGPKCSGPSYDQIQLLATGSPLTLQAHRMSPGTG